MLPIASKTAWYFHLQVRDVFPDRRQVVFLGQKLEFPADHGQARSAVGSAGTLEAVGFPGHAFAVAGGDGFLDGLVQRRRVV